MALKTYSAESGTQGTALTTGNSGATTISATGGAITYDSAAAQNGALGYKFVSGAGNICIARFPVDVANTVMAFEGSVTVPSAAGENILLASMRHASGIAFRIIWDQTIKAISVDESTVIGNTEIARNLTPGGKYRVAVLLQVGASTTTGKYSVNLYAGNATTPINATPVTKSTANLGTNPIAAGDFGVVSAAAASTTVMWDDVRFSDGATTEIGSVPSTIAPANSVRPNSIASNPGAWVNVGGAASLDAALADESDTTYLETPAAPAGAAVSVGLAPLTLGDVTIKARHQASAASPAVTRIYDLMQGTTVIATRSVTLPTAWTDYTFTTTTAETAAIASPRSNLVVRVTDTSA